MTNRILTLLMIFALMLAACAPDDLDITPSPTPTATPEPTATPPPTSTPNPDAADAPDAEPELEVDALDTLLAAFPSPWSAGAAQWRRTNNETTKEDVTYKDETDGKSFKIYYTEATGSFAEITVALFDDADAAQVYYDRVASITRTLENAEARDNFPTPNLFGGGLYGQDALVLNDNIVVRVSVPRFNSAQGDPLGPLMSSALRVIENAAS